MNSGDNQRLSEWLDHDPHSKPELASADQGSPDASEPWEIQSTIDTLLRLQSRQLSISSDFEERLGKRLDALQDASNAESDSLQTGAEPPTKTQTNGDLRSTVRGRRILWWSPAVAAAILGIIIASPYVKWIRHPAPQVTGTFRVVGGGTLQSDSTLVTDESTAQVTLGGYCSVTIDPHTHLTLGGESGKEHVELETGSIVCEVERGNGQFTVITDLGSVSVLGTKFEVGIEEEKRGNMISKTMLINVLVGTVLVTTANGETQTLNEGQSTKVSQNTDPFIDGGYQLVWSDEFENDGVPDPKNWVFEEGFVRNNEDQWYQKDNARCVDGMLVITGREDIKRNPNYVKGSTERKFIEYTSSSLMTKGLHSWTMGRFVMRAKIPHGEGMWPAFWTVGELGEWPSCGEIDIMEYYQEKLLANVASGTSKRWNANWHGESIKTEKLGGEKWLNEFHIWRMDWDNESIRLYVDDKLLNETKLDDTINSNLAWGPKNPFHHPQYIIVNLALGGMNGGDMEKAKIPAKYEIDYVRVYQRDEDRSFKPADTYVPPPRYTGNRVGIHHFSELPTSVNKKCSWEKGADSRSYAWKAPGSTRESAEMEGDYNDKVEGQLSYRFVLRNGWSRWVLEMDPNYGEGVADLTKFKTMRFAVKSSDAKAWDGFRVIIGSRGGTTYEADLESLGFVADGEWHRCEINLEDVANAKVDLSQISTLFAIGWEGGVKNGQSFKLDDLHLE